MSAHRRVVTDRQFTSRRPDLLFAEGSYGRLLFEADLVPLEPNVVSRRSLGREGESDFLVC